LAESWSLGRLSANPKRVTVHSFQHSFIDSFAGPFIQSIANRLWPSFSVFFFLSFRICVNPTRPDYTPFIQRMLVQFFTWHHPFPSNGLVDKQHNLRDLIWFYLFDSFVCRLQRVNNYKLAFARWASDVGTDSRYKDTFVSFVFVECVCACLFLHFVVWFFVCLILNDA